MKKKSNQFVSSAHTMTSSNELPPDLNETFSVHLRLCKFVGLIIFDDDNEKFIRKYGRLIFFSLMCTLLSVLTITYVVIQSSRFSILDVTDTIPCAAAFIQDLVGLTALVYKKNEIKYLIYDIAEVWLLNIDGDKRKEEIKKNWLWRMAAFTRANIVVVIIGLVFFFIPSITITLYGKYAKEETAYLFPFNMYYFCENHTGLYSYLPVYFFEIFFGSCIHICIHLPCMLLLTILSYNVSMMMRWLQIDLENVLEVSNGRVVINEDRLKNIIKVHQKLLRICEKFNECFGVSLFLTVCFSSLIIGFFAFLALAIDGKYIVSAFVISFEIFNLAWPGQLLADMSYGIAETAYGTPWYDCDLRFKKFIFIIIQRSQKPAQLSTLGFSNLTLSLFARVLKSSWSYLSILNCIHSDRHP